MDINLLGELIVASAAQTSNGFWMPAGGNDGVAGVEVFLNTDASAFSVSVQTKSSDEADPAAGVGIIGSVTIASVTTAAPVTYKFDLSNAKDLIRYVITSSRAGKVHMQLAQPLWHHN
jgi:hypothetical protein